MRCRGSAPTPAYEVQRLSLCRALLPTASCNHFFPNPPRTLVTPPPPRTPCPDCQISGTLTPDLSVNPSTLHLAQAVRSARHPPPTISLTPTPDPFTLPRLSDQRDVALQETAPITSIALAPSPPSSLASLGNHPWPYCGGFGAGTSWHPGMPAGAGGMGAEAAGRYLLVNLQGHTVHLWDLGEMTQPYSPGSVTAGFDPMDEV